MTPKRRSGCRKGTRSHEKRVSHIILDDDDDDHIGARVSMPRGCNVGGVDPDYQLHLKDLGVGVENVNENCADVGCGVPVKGDLSDVDSDYKLFLNMLRVDRNGYTLELPISDGLSLILACEDPAAGRPWGVRQKNVKEGDGGRPVNADAKGFTRKLKDVSSGAKHDAGPCRGRQNNHNEGDVGGQPGSGMEHRDISQRKHVTTQTDGGPKTAKRKLKDVFARVKNRASQPVNVTKRGCSLREHVAAQGDREPKATKRKLEDVSTGVKKRASEPANATKRACSHREYLAAQGDRGPKGTERKLEDVSTGVEKGASEPANTTKRGCSHREYLATQGNRGPKGTKRKLEDVSTGVEKGASEPLPGKHDNLPADFINSEARNNVKSEIMDVPNSPKEQHKLQNNQTYKEKLDPVDIFNSPKEQQNEQKNNERSDLMDIVNPPKEQQKGKIDSMGIFSSHKEQQNEQSYSDSDVMILNDNPVNPTKSCTPLVVLDADDGEVTNVGIKCNFPQDAELLRLLKQPFDEGELKTLMKDFQCRLPVVGRKELRGGLKTFKSEVAGLSYQDRYKDLADQIRFSNEKAKTLNLLRGFFHWMQKLAHGTMLPPWKDPSYLEVLPTGCSLNGKVD